MVQLNSSWFRQMAQPTTGWREKMTLFWHNHFACRTRNAYLAQQQNNTIREHALGKFGDLLMAVSKDPAMLQFLNNQQNKKDSPNENFAREVMELFTLGRGNYTEDDVKNAARAFTGWAFQPKTGAFFFRQGQHDVDEKIFRGKRGNFSGEDILHMILEDRQTARFITNKIWKYFVHAEQLDEGLRDDLAERFYKSDYDISQLMDELFRNPKFYSQSYVGSRVKSPIELLLGIQQHTGGTFSNPENVIFLQKALGQVLFLPPNVGGWPNGNSWIDSSSLTFRMSLPNLLFKQMETEFQSKDDGDVNEVTNQFKKGGKISFSVDWKKLNELFAGATEAETISKVEDFLLCKPTTDGNRKLIASPLQREMDETERMRKLFTGFMSLPEYQLS